MPTGYEFDGYSSMLSPQLSDFGTRIRRTPARKSFRSGRRRLPCNFRQFSWLRMLGKSRQYRFELSLEEPKGLGFVSHLEPFGLAFGREDA